MIAVISFGPRSALGFFLTPLSSANGWGRDVFALALAMQNLLWGVGQPFAGAIADQFGAPRVLSAGAILYALGLVPDGAIRPRRGMLYISAGVLIGFGLSGCSLPSVIGALGKLVPESWRSFAFGAGTAAGSFGQFLFSPLAVQPDRQLRLADHAADLRRACCCWSLPLSLTLMAPRGAPRRRAPRRRRNR